MDTEELEELEETTAEPEEPDLTVLEAMENIQTILLTVDGQHIHNLWVYDRGEEKWHEEVLEAANQRFDIFPGAHLCLQGHEMIVVEAKNTSDGGGYVYIEPLKTNTCRPTTKAGWQEWWQQQLAARGVELRRTDSYTPAATQPTQYMEFVSRET